MQIIVDALPLSEKPTGIQIYVLNMLKSLAHIDRKNKYTIYGTRLSKAELGIENNNFRIKGVPRSAVCRYLWRIWYQTGFAAQLSLIKPDLFLSTHHMLPIYCQSPVIAVLYDATPLIIKGALSWCGYTSFKINITHTARRADIIVTISNSSKKDLAGRLGIKPKKISVVYPGYDDEVFKPQTDRHKVETVRRKFNISSNYILYIGTLQTNKNIPRLIKAFSLLKKERKISHQLVIVGKKYIGYEAILRAFHESAASDDIILTGYVPTEELPLLISGADVFVFPSLYEGFGLPPLEAMACGTPVITSNVSSLPEAVGDAGILVDPYNIREIAEAMYRVISDGNLREQMRRKGLERARLFSWHKAAKEMLRLFEAFSR